MRATVQLVGRLFGNIPVFKLFELFFQFSQFALLASETAFSAVDSFRKTEFRVVEIVD